MKGVNALIKIDISKYIPSKQFRIDLNAIMARTVYSNIYCFLWSSAANHHICRVHYTVCSIYLLPDSIWKNLFRFILLPRKHICSFPIWLMSNNSLSKYCYDANFIRYHFLERKSSSFQFISFHLMDTHGRSGGLQFHFEKHLSAHERLRISLFCFLRRSFFLCAEHSCFCIYFFWKSPRES